MPFETSRQFQKNMLNCTSVNGLLKDVLHEGGVEVNCEGYFVQNMGSLAEAEE